jgi:outer membrane protein assembly factor BamB
LAKGKIGLSFGIIILFLLSAIAPMTTGINTDSKVDVELNRMLDNLRFMCMGPDGLIVEKYEYYKEQLLNMYSSESSNDDVESDNKESITPVEKPSIPILSSGGPMDSAWSMKCHDNRHTGQSPYITADNPYIEKWRFFADGWVEETPVIDDNGTIYFASTGWKVYAINPDGTEKWRFQTGGYMTGSSPVIAEDGTIYIGCWDSKLYALNPDGTKKWAVVIGGNVASSPAIAEDGTIYIGQTNSKIVAINPNGTIKWKYTTGAEIYSDPAIGDDGTIYIGSNDDYLYALNPDGTLKWRFKTAKAVGGSPSIADDGTIYVAGVWDNWLYALYPNNGTVKWKCNIKVSCANPSIDSNGCIYVGGDEKLYAIYPNGSVKWSCFLGNERWVGPSAPAISADGTIYVGTNIGSGVEGGDIIAINPNGTIRWRKKIAKEWVDSSPSIAEDGTVYIGSAYMPGRGYLHAFGSQESNSPPDAPTISGETNGEPGKEYWYACVAYDPDNNPLKLFVDWGDGNSGWVTHVDWWASGEDMWAEHTYSSSGKYTIRAKVKDVFEEESDWGELTVTMPRDKSTDNMLFRLLERFPLISRLLNIGWSNLE